MPRELHFEWMHDILNDAEQLAAAGEPTSEGNWTAAQNIDHVARVIDMSTQGVNFTFPLPLRIFGRLFRSRALNSPIKPGFKIPKAAQADFAPPPDVTLHDALEHLRRSVAEAEQPNAMTQQSPLFGRMSPDDWRKLHCRHAELHFGMLHPAGAH